MFHRESVNRFCNKVDKTKKKHWINWLKAATSRDIYVANKYVTNDPLDYTNARIPILSTSSPEGIKYMAIKNRDKVEVLAKTFFPPPQLCQLFQSQLTQSCIKPMAPSPTSTFNQRFRNSSHTKRQGLIVCRMSCFRNV